MLYLTDSKHPYQDYEAQVAAHVIKHRRLAEARAAQAREPRAWQKVQLWLSALRVRVKHHLQPAEPDGYIA